MGTKVKVYMVIGSEHNGCEGWNSWIMEDSITCDYSQAVKFTDKYKDTYIRTDIICKEIEIVM